MRLSKSRFTSGLQCHKQLWWRVHEPQSPELVPDLEQQALFDQGHIVGAKAQERFPGGVLVDGPYSDFAGRIAQTKAALTAEAPAIFEAAFFVDDVFVAVDVLERIGHGWTVVEVKSSTSVKEQHTPDAAIQTHVLRRSGLDVERVEIMHLNRACRFPDLRNLFVRADVTAQVEATLPEVTREATAQLRMLAGPLPDVATGQHCEAPYECPFRERCWPVAPDHHVRTLYGIGKQATSLETQGMVTIHDLPDGLALSLIAARQRLSVQENRLVVESSLRNALGPLAYPCAALDFETVQLAIPVWNGCRPYDQVPAQFSCHVVTEQKDVAHHAWLADNSEDPRPEIAARVVDACRGAAVVVAYNASFEKTVLGQLAEAVPDQAEALADIQARLVDALPLVRDHVYHPEFGGSFSLKAVLPALVPGTGYEGLEIASGGLASLKLRRLMFDLDVSPDEREQTRQALRQYCAVDTLGVVRLLDRLRAMAGSEIRPRAGEPSESGYPE
jgi:predicted RecB family nuclease